MGAPRNKPSDLKCSATSQHRRELGEFLQAKRAGLKPADLRLHTFGPRRVTGLRREELAAAAGVGVSWYTWLEQGRNIHVSSEMLERVASTLRLSSSDTAYLFSLAGRQPPEIREVTPRLDAALQTVLDGYTSGPAFAYDEFFDVLAFNRLADFVYRFDDYDGPRGRNMIWRNFMDPYRRQLYVAWQEMATMAVGLVRGVYASHKSNQRLEQLLKDLCSGSPEFDRLWKMSRRTGTSSYVPNQFRFNVPRVGILSFIAVRMAMATRADWLVIFLSPTDKETAKVMGRMTSRLKP